MLLGEHAVLHGRRALVCAINKRITVSILKTTEKTVRIVSDLGTYESLSGELTDHPDFRFVLDAIRQYPPEQGVEMKIESDFPSDIGFGSSAAVTVAVHAALTGRIHDRMELFKRSLATVRRVQGRGSGADVAASVFGGAVVYRADPLEILPLPETFPLTAVYSGSKMKTAEVIALVELARADHPEKFERIFDEMDAGVGEVLNDFSRLGEMLTTGQKMMEQMGLCNDALAEIIRHFRQQGIAAKISGSGLGDCAVGLGTVSSIGTYPVYPLQVSPEGVRDPFSG